MKLSNIVDSQGRGRLGIQTPDGTLDVTGICSAPGFEAGLTCTDDAIANPAILTRLQSILADPLAFSQWRLPEGSFRTTACVRSPEKIICIGLNYRKHAIESRMPVPAHPVVFSKFNNSLAAPGEEIPLPANAVQYDYEVELGVIIGRRARNVPVAQALGHVFGYCAVNDLSARDLQMRTPQWLLGKTLDAFMPMGPCIVTAEEIPDPQRLGLKCWVNGELRQDSSTADMIFSVAEIVSYLSEYMTLKPGDVVSTGTPEGVVFGMKEPIWLKAGDHTSVEIDGLGGFSNRLVAA